MIHLILFTAFVLWYADFEGKDDNVEIAEHKPINHVAQWLTRAAVFGSVWYLLWVLVGKPSTWPILIGHALLFSAVFRWRLNKRRGKHWAYIAPWSNVYDRVWFAVSTGHWDSAEWLEMLSDVYHADAPGATKTRVHRAGRIAYGFEITLFALCTAGAVVMQLKG